MKGQEEKKWRIAYTRFHADEKGDWHFARPVVTDEDPFDTAAPHHPLVESLDECKHEGKPWPTSPVAHWSYEAGEYATKEEAEVALENAPVEQIFLVATITDSDYIFIYKDGRWRYSSERTLVRDICGRWRYVRREDALPC